MKYDWNDINPLIDQNYLTIKKHDKAQIYIVNYTAKCQYNKFWNDITLSARGLILRKTGDVLARPFKKFFNYGEIPSDQIPNLPFEVYDKMDGSLGIGYSLKGKSYIATRGSFYSDQAIKATQMLREKYPEAQQAILDNRDRTYLFEIIYPENRIVLNYGEREELVLLAVIDNETGKDLPLEDIGVPIVKKHDGLNDWNEILNRNIDNEEGYIIKFQNDFRLKVKFSEYVRLHKIITNVNAKDVWKAKMAEYAHVSSNLQLEKFSVEQLLENVPDEFYAWVKSTLTEMENSANELIENTIKNYNTIISDLTHRVGVVNIRDFVEHAKKGGEKDFQLLINLHKRGKEFMEMLAWKYQEPQADKPFFKKNNE